ncbi:MAG TPA: DCC1-like thiol-disulfide oxidoreductase family protein [Thermoanaerobaculia bacterium]|nr:DCC1-like thiol-disulfide oxidoreductase family protein [Thermoanaerobaculia bacterium]
MSFQTLAADALTESGSLLSPSSNLVLYDGVCGLCNRLVRLLLVADRKAVLCFAPLQGATAARVRQRRDLPQDLDTLVYVRGFGLADEQAYLRSDAVLLALADVGGVWWLAGALRVIPRPLRDGVYRWVARRRYGWFGKYETCPLPPPEHRARFLP